MRNQSSGPSRRTAAAVCLCIPRLVVVLWTTAGRTRRPLFCGAQTNAWSMCLVRSYHIGLCTSTRCTASKGSSAHVSPSRDAGSGRGDVHASRPEGRGDCTGHLGPPVPWPGRRSGGLCCTAELRWACSATAIAPLSSVRLDLVLCVLRRAVLLVWGTECPTIPNHQRANRECCGCGIVPCHRLRLCE